MHHNYPFPWGSENASSVNNYWHCTKQSSGETHNGVLPSHLEQVLSFLQIMTFWLASRKWPPDRWVLSHSDNMLHPPGPQSCFFLYHLFCYCNDLCSLGLARPMQPLLKHSQPICLSSFITLVHQTTQSLHTNFHSLNIALLKFILL